MVLKILLGVLAALFAGSQAERRGFAAERRSASAMRAKPARKRRLALHDVLQEPAIRDTRTRGTIRAIISAGAPAYRGRHLVVKRIAMVLIAVSLAASPAHADGVKALAGTLGIGAISSMLCVLTVIYGEDAEDSSSEGFDRRGFFIGAGAGFAGENFSDKPVNDIADIFSDQPALGLPPPLPPVPDTTATSDDGWSVKGYGGYRCHPRYSVSASIEYFGGFDTQWTGLLGTGGGDIDIITGGFDIKGYLLTGRYQPYLLLGGGTMAIDTKVTNPTGITGTCPPTATPGCDPTVDPPPPTEAIIGPVTQHRSYKDFVFRVGGGFDLYATEHVVVNIGASYWLPLGEVSGVDLFTVGGGIEYRF